MKFRRKPEIVDAVQWWPPGHSQHVPIEGVEKGPCEDQPYVIVSGLWHMTVLPGEWIVKDARRVVAVFDHASFVEYFEEVREQSDCIDTFNPPPYTITATFTPPLLAVMPEREFQDLEGDAMP